MNDEQPPVVILCGGQGTRLKEETEFRPKPMVGIGGRPLLWHIMQTFAHHGMKSFMLALGFKGSVIRDFFLNYRDQTSDLTIKYGGHGEDIGHTYHQPHDIEGWDVTLADTGALTNTGGRIHRLRAYLAGRTFFMTYGDGVADIDVQALLAHHRREGKLATVTGVHPTSRYGVLEPEDDGRVLFREKPLMDTYISGGFFVLEPEVLDYLDADCVFEQLPLQRLSQDNQLSVYHHDGFWMSIDTYREYLEINRMWSRGNRPWAVWDHPEQSSS